MPRRSPVRPIRNQALDRSTVSTNDEGLDTGVIRDPGFVVAVEDHLNGPARRGIVPTAGTPRERVYFAVPRVTKPRHSRIPAWTIARRTSSLVASVRVVRGDRTVSAHLPSSDNPYFAPQTPGSVNMAT